MIVVKVGGSLFDWPELGSKLRSWLTTLPPGRVLLVPGGGATADAVRALDRTHQLGEEASHWLALAALSVNARFLQRLLPETRIVAEPASLACASGSDTTILDPYPFLAADDQSPDHLPHSWLVTSDSLAVRAAVVAQARELTLLKSIDWRGDDWSDASRAGVVDGYFAAALQQGPGLRVRVVNLRS